MKYLTHWATALITLTIVSFIGFSDPYLKETARLKSFDFLQQYDEPQKSERIVIVEIDEKSIEQKGQFPWSREVMGNLVYDLWDAGAKVIVLPILFSEPDSHGQDEYFAGALVQTDTIIAQVGSQQTDKNGVHRPVASIGDPMPFLFEWSGMLGPIEILGINSKGVGVINTAPEIDGVVRRLPLTMKVGDKTYPSMTMETLRVMMSEPSYIIKSTPSGIDSTAIEPFIAKTDSYGRQWLRWNKEFETISATGTIEDYAKVVGNKIVIISPTATGLSAVIPTPKGEQYSYMPIATSLEGMINKESLVRTPEATFVEFAVSVALGLLLIFLASKTPYWLSGLFIILIPTTSVFGSYYYYINHLQLWDFSWIVFVTIIVGLHAIFNRFVKEFFEKQKIKKQFAGYCSPEVVKLLQENPELIKEGIKKEISICFSDLRGFTPLGESFGDDVKGLTEIMNGYMDAISQPILDNKGMVIKYIGDASMHIHNAPIEDPDHAYTAVKTGLEMLKAVEKFNEKIIDEGHPAVGMGAGINTGLGYIGEMGSSKRHSYDVLGDAVSTTARLESQCKNYGVLLIVGPETKRRTENDFFYLKLDDLAVKGKSVGLDIYTVLDKHYPEKLRDAHNDMHKCYRNQEFEKAIILCESLMGRFDNKMDNYYDMWIERCEYMKSQDLPKDWDGIFRATTK